MDRQAAHSCINHTVAAFATAVATAVAAAVATAVATAETVLTVLVQQPPGLQIAIVLEYMDGGSLGDILQKVSHWSCAPSHNRQKLSKMIGITDVCMSKS